MHSALCTYWARRLVLDPSKPQLTDEQRSALKHNIQLMRDAIVLFTATGAARGVSGHTGAFVTSPTSSRAYSAGIVMSTRCETAVPVAAAVVYCVRLARDCSLAPVVIPLFARSGGFGRDNTDNTAIGGAYDTVPEVNMLLSLFNYSDKYVPILFDEAGKCSPTPVVRHAAR